MSGGAGSGALPPGVRLVVLDIEGTLAPIDFVVEVMFPYARARLAEAIARAVEDPRLGEAIALLDAERLADAGNDRDRARPLGAGGEARAGAELPPDDLAAYAARLMDEDRKSTGLKALQGLIWERGFAAGALVARLFPEVAATLAACRARGLRLRIYSSGSVLAQRLFFAHTEAGDLTALFEGFHDTVTGPKREAASYAAIARAAGLAPGALLFLSDVVAEVEAARAAGLHTALVVRPGNAPQPAHDHPVWTDLRPLGQGG